jgi:hypothetical protein
MSFAIECGVKGVKASETEALEWVLRTIPMLLQPHRWADDPEDDAERRRVILATYHESQEATRAVFAPTVVSAPDPLALELPLTPRLRVLPNPTTYSHGG